jgi:hypothetical protein
VSNYINETLLDTSPYKKQQDQAAHLITKWEKTGLLEGLTEGYKKNNMAIMLENQAKQLINEASVGSPSGGTVGSAFKGDEEWSGVALPLVRRIFADIAAQEFVSVQPMNLPSGLIFYLDMTHGTTTSGMSSGDSVFGKQGPFTPSGSSAPYGKDTGFYGAGRYGYTAPSQSVSVRFSGATTATMKQINFDADVSQSYGGALWKMTGVLTASRVDVLSARGWTISSTGSSAVGTGGKVLNQFTSVDTTREGASQHTVTVIVSASSADVAFGEYNVQYLEQPTEAVRGDFEQSTAGFSANPETDLNIPEINLNLKSRPIVAKTRKLKAVWTPEMAQDLNAYHSVDAEAELTSMLSEYISMEIDLEILDMLIADAVTVDYWSTKPGNDYDSASNSFVNTTFYGTRFEWYQTLVAKIQKVSNEIHRLTLRGGANFVVCSPKVATILESLPGYNANIPGGDVAANQEFSMGVTKIGAVNNQFQVYKNPYMHENTILLGYRGTNFLETGAVYSPYVPLIMTPLVYDPKNFQPRKGVMTRYAKKMVRPEFYGKVYVADLNIL